jgi:hypothetical protein
MSFLLQFLLTFISMLPIVDSPGGPIKTFNPVALKEDGNDVKTLDINFQDKRGFGHIRSIIFKSQEYCRAELKNFEFDAPFSVVSATVYFSGTNFPGIQTGFITSNSLKPVKHLMNQCLPGSVVVFDDVRVKGPDSLVRTIHGVSLTLY